MNSRTPVVAVVDDDPRLLASLANLLESAGYAVRSFPSALSLVASGAFDMDALVTDVGMAGMSGFELRDHVRRARPDLPVFLITGRHEIAERDQAQGISGFFRKPFDAQLLLSAVADALNNRMEGKDEN